MIMANRLVKNFEELEIWKNSVQLAKEIYLLSENPKSKLYRDYGLRDQVRRAAVSISSNIAEGFESGSRRMFIRYLKIAKASSGEVRSQLYIIYDLGLIDTLTFDRLKESCLKSSAQIQKLIHSLNRSKEYAIK
jgi:four helix bundle protein